MKKGEEDIGEYVKEIRGIMSMKEEERDWYVRSVLESFIGAIEELKRKSGFESIEKFKELSLVEKKKVVERIGKIGEKFLKEFEKKRVTIVACLIYAIKPEFRDIYLRLLKIVSGG